MSGRRYSTGSVRSSRRSLTSHASSPRTSATSVKTAKSAKKKNVVKNKFVGRRYSLPQTWRYSSDFDTVITDDTYESPSTIPSVPLIEPSPLENFDLVHSLHMIKLLNFIKMFSKDKERLDIYQAVFDNPRRYCCLAFPT